MNYFWIALILSTGYALAIAVLAIVLLIFDEVTYKLYLKQMVCFAVVNFLIAFSVSFYL